MLHDKSHTPHPPPSSIRSVQSLKVTHLLSLPKKLHHLSKASSVSIHTYFSLSPTISPYKSEPVSKTKKTFLIIQCFLSSMAFLQSLKLFCLQLLAFCIIALRFPPISVHALNIGIETNAGISLEKECSRTCESKFCAVPPLLRYGKYCGVLYSGCPGEQPCDGLDACCMKHDLCIQRKGNNYLNLECNQSFLNCVATFTKSGAPSFKGNTCSVGTVVRVITDVIDAAVVAGKIFKKP